MHRIVFLGPPGAGKGTQADEFARELKVPHISTGDLLRTAVAARTPLGVEADGYMRAGQLVPDDLVLRMLEERLRAPDARPGFILDGFPRTTFQAEALERIAPIDRVVSFDLPEEVVRQRLNERRTCPNCHSVYNLVTQPPKLSGICDRCGHALMQRSDDRPEAVATRLQAYRTQTAPLLEYYRARRTLHPIDAQGTPSDVSHRIRAVLD